MMGRTMVLLSIILMKTIRDTWTIICQNKHTQFCCQRMSGCKCYHLITCFTTFVSALCIVSQEELHGKGEKHFQH